MERLIDSGLVRLFELCWFKSLQVSDDIIWVSRTKVA